MSLLTVATYTSFVWAAKCEDLKEQGHLPTAREHPMELM